MESEQKLQTLIHMAIDVKNRQINQHYLVKLFEIIIKNSPQLANCDVDLTPNDEKHSQTNVSNKGIHEVSINPFNGIFDVSSSNHEEMLYEYENEEMSYKYENEENSSLTPENKLDDFSNSDLTLEDKKSLMEKSESCLYEWTGNLETQQNVVLLRLNTSLRTDRFMTQEWVCLNLGMSAGNFREFDLDYRTNFKNIFNFLELQKSVNRNTRIDIQQLKKKCIKIQKYIKKHIDMDPEATGIVAFMKGACMSCGRPAKMVKTKRLSLNYSGHRRQFSNKSNPIEKKEIYHSNSDKTIKNKPKQSITNNQCMKPTTIPTETCLWINSVPQPCHPFLNKRTGNVEIDLERIRADVNSRKTINNKLNSNNPREKPAMKPSIKVCGFIRNALQQRTTSLISSIYDDSNFSCCFKGHQKRKSKKRQIWKS